MRVARVLHEPEADVDADRLVVDQGDERGPAVLIGRIAEVVSGRGTPRREERERHDDGDQYL